MWGLGVTEGDAQFCDVYGLDDELLTMVPQPVLAVIFLYPLTSAVKFLPDPSRSCDVETVMLSFVAFMGEQDDKVEEYDASSASTAGGKVRLSCPA
jgi:ubiquitin carboxyl-terminal hydrolase L3